MEAEAGEATPAPVETAAPKVKMHLVSDDIYTRVVSEGFKDFNFTLMMNGCTKMLILIMII